MINDIPSSPRCDNNSTCRRFQAMKNIDVDRTKAIIPLLVPIFVEKGAKMSRSQRQKDQDTKSRMILYCSDQSNLAKKCRNRRDHLLSREIQQQSNCIRQHSTEESRQREHGIYFVRKQDYTEERKTRATSLAKALKLVTLRNTKMAQNENEWLLR